MSDRSTISGDDIRSFLADLQLPFDDNEAAMQYHEVSAGRYALTINALGRLNLDQAAKTLELAANPYGMTAYLAARLFPDLTLASYSETPEVKDINLSVGSQSFCLKEFGFNVERQVWPFRDEEFDLVIACEIIEHLAMDPMNLLVEANRVIRPGGHLFISTPNAASIQNFIKLAKMMPAGLAAHFRQPPSLERLYERHNREYSPFTLGEMFQAAGFEIALMESDSAWHVDPYGMSQEDVEGLLKIIGMPELRRDTLSVVGRKASGVVERYPTAHDLYMAGD